MQKNYATLMKDQPLPIFIFSDDYNLDLGPHVFPAIKFGHIYSSLQEDRRFKKHSFVEPGPASLEQAQLAHSSSYIKDLVGLEHSKRLNRSELPLNKEIVDAFFLSCGGSIEASRQALQHRRAMNLGGGFHHAFRDQAEGFCYLNDIAIAIRCMQAEEKVERALVIDLDVHQGNGTAKIFKYDRKVFTFSMHETNNYPQKKEKSSLDVELRTAIADDDYLQLLSDSLEKIRLKFEPDIIYYLGGVDIYRLDRLGGLSVTREGLRKRDQMVRDFMPEIPLVTVLAGGYAIDDIDTVDLHLQTAEVLADLLVND